MIALLLALALVAAPAGAAQPAAPAVPLQVARGPDGLVVVTWRPPATQAQAAVIVRRDGVDTLIEAVGNLGHTRVVARCGERITITFWNADAQLIGVGHADAPCAVWLPLLRR